MTGCHILLDLYQPKFLSVSQWEDLLNNAVAAAGVSLISLEIKKFEPQGLTAYCILSESHLAVHTWPEKDYIGIDLFTCGTRCQPEKAVELLVRELAPAKSEVRRLERGSLAQTESNLETSSLK